MKALKGIMTYIGIVLLAIMVISALVIGFMFFTKANIFGFYFVRAFENRVYMGQYEPGSNIRTINLAVEAGQYGVVVEPSQSNVISVTTDNQYVGFLKDNGVKKGNGKSEPNLIPNLYKEVGAVVGNTMNISYKLEEPTGLLSISKTSKIFVEVPYSLGGVPVKYNISVKTTNGNINLQNSIDNKSKEFEFPLNTTSLNLETRRGDVIFKGLGSSTKESDNKILTLSELNIKTQGGTFDFRNFDEVRVGKKVVLDSKKANYLFKKLVACENNSGNYYGGSGGLEINGTTVKLNADMVICGSDGFIFKTSTGVLKVKNLFTGEFGLQGKDNLKVVNSSDGNIIPYENTIFTDSAVVELGSVVGKLGLYNEFGDVRINLLSNQATMRTENGNITVISSGTYLNEVDNTKKYSDTSSMILYSTYGDITVEEYFQDAVIYSKKGKIVANSKYHTESGYDRSNRYYYSDISTKDGKITASTEKNPMKIVASDSANIKFVLHDILDNTKNPFGDSDMYQVVSKNGTVDVTLPLKSYKVKVESKRLEGSIGATTNFGEDYVQINTEKATQPTIKLKGNKVKLACSV